MAWLRSLVKLLGACILAGVLVAGVLFPVVGGLGLLSNKASDTVDSVSAELNTGVVPQTSVMLDSAGAVLATFWGNQRRTVVPGDRIAQTMKLAIVSVEDKRFYSHDGVDYRGTFRAFVNNSQGEATQGGSTLTQQYVKNYLLLVTATNDLERRQATEATPARKLREIRIALALDKELGKDEILTRYLNIVPFGNGAYGVQAAAQTYFGVNAADLTVPQSAMLAGMVQSSSALNPYRRPVQVKQRRDTVLDTMRESGVLTPGDTTAAKALPLGVLPEPNSPGNGCIAANDRGFFCDYARKYLADHGITEDMLDTGGYTIKTTLDPQVQNSVKAATNVDVPPDQPRIANIMDVVQPGQDKHRVLAMASSRGYGLDGAAKQTVLGQPYVPVADGAGSIFKIFTTAAAMEKGLGTNAVLDNPQRFTVEGFGVGGNKPCGPKQYCVKNYSDNYGPKYSVTDALAKSPNTAFVKLITQIGVTPTVDMAVRLGMRSLASTPDPNDPSKSVAQYMKDTNSAAFTLGVNQVNTVELANSAATISSAGMWCPPSPVESVTDVSGKPVDIGEQACEQVVPPGLANTLAVAMSKDDAAGGTSNGAANSVDWQYPVSGKTGTTNAARSAGFVGFTNTLAGANIVFDDSPTPFGIAIDGFRPSTCGGPDCGRITGGRTAAHTFYTALKPVMDKFGPVNLPPTEPQYVDGSGAGNVPSVVGQGTSQATATLTGQGFTVTTSRVQSGRPRGTVERQSVTGASIPGAAITLYVSSGQSARPSRAPAPTNRPGPPDQPAPTDQPAPPDQPAPAEQQPAPPLPVPPPPGEGDPGVPPPAVPGPGN